ncbi:MAG: DUF6285 domain-containing protein [Rhodovarius sp.]|nr:DUF6285 domain-containing protein [Rhodovarius sp.]MCX7933467.1 DUF6285 domain-containing protein [Rhodovarius sp.]MDW8314791.1 DUF6285 domain-containing protein [Rhodovarius sp.]
MQEAPDAADLLATARAVVLEKLLPALPAEARLEARMVARALEVAARLIADRSVPRCPPGLAQAIRAGRCDGDAAVLEAIRADTLARLRVSNPRALEG